MDKQSIYNDMERHLMEDSKPSGYFNEMLSEPGFRDVYPFTMLTALIDTPQSLQFHPEGNVWNHTMMVVDNAAGKKQESREPRVFMWAALLHDIGKTSTTKLRKGRYTAYDHDRVGEKMSVDFLKEFVQDMDFIDSVSKLIRWHMQILFVVKDLPYADLKSVLSEVSADEVALLGLCDRLGRGEMTAEKAEGEHKAVDIFLQKCRKYINAI